MAGCDGAKSVVRAAAGIDFEGTPDSWQTVLGDIELTDPPEAPALTLDQPGGALYMVSLGGGRHRVAVIDHATLFAPADGPVTFEELRASTLRVAGTDFGMRATPDAWLSRVGNATRQAARYRAGRVLLAGDAAHIHYPAGGQGLNLGLQDATNLAWKLAAEIRGWAPPGLLDSYHDERYPVGLDVIDDSLAQCGLIANPSREGIALRDRFNRILGAQPAVCRDLARRLSGLAIRYPADGPLACRRVPDLALRDAPAATIFGLLHAGRFVLLTLRPPSGPADALARLRRPPRPGDRHPGRPPPRLERRPRPAHPPRRLPRLGNHRRRPARARHLARPAVTPKIKINTRIFPNGPVTPPLPQRPSRRPFVARPPAPGSDQQNFPDSSVARSPPGGVD